MHCTRTQLTLDKLNELVERANEKGEGLYLSSLTSIPEGFNPTVGGDLYLGSLTSIPEGFNPTVSGYLDLRSLTSIPEGFNPTVGGDLDLSSLTSIPEGFNPTVGGYLYLRSLIKLRYKKLRDGDYEPGNYIYADGILTHVKRERKHGEYTFYVGKIPGRNVITDGKLYAHGRTFSECVRDLEFKKAKDRGSSQYKNLTLDSVVKKDDAIMMYRVITGACQQGTERFLSTIKELKDKYTVRELIEITRGQYRANIFEKFFKE